VGKKEKEESPEKQYEGGKGWSKKKSLAIQQGRREENVGARSTTGLSRKKDEHAPRKE